MNWSRRTDMVQAIKAGLSAEDSPFELITSRSEGSNLWCAMRVKADGKEFITLYQFRKSNGHWRYREIAEEGYPVSLSCPLAVLDAVKPTTDKEAQQWRLAVRRHQEALGLAKAELKSLRVGETLSLYGKRYTTLYMPTPSRWIAEDSTGRQYEINARAYANAILCVE